MQVLYENMLTITLPQVIMWVIGAVLIYLAIVKEMEPTLLLPMGFGAILVNLPNSGAAAVIEHLFEIGIAGHELFPLLLFIGIGAMIDFEPLLTNPKLMIFGAAAHGDRHAGHLHCDRSYYSLRLSAEQTRQQKIIGKKEKSAADFSFFARH